jgi:hypothetical protein
MAALLVAAQWGAMLHAFEHEAGKPLSQVCTTCVAASQLGFACIDTPPTVEAPACYAVQNTDTTDERDSLEVPAARQRGPPISL